MSNTSDDFIRVSLESLSVDSVLGFDLYRKGDGPPRLYRHRSVPISGADIESLIEYGQDSLYVPATQKGELMVYLRGNLPALLRDKSIPTATKLEVLLESSVNILSGALQDPRSADGHRSVAKQSRNHVTLALSGEEARRLMVDCSVSASVPVLHAIRVSNLSILLGLRCSIDNHDELCELGAGAALHEIGKSILDGKYYLRKSVKTQVSNARLMKYPDIGVNILNGARSVSAGALAPVREHQERLDGTGFPAHLMGPQISPAGRIVAICDHFDEHVSGGEGRKRSTAFEVLQRMRESSGKFDSEILRQFILLLAGELGSELY